MRVMRDETFGPVIPIMKVQSDDEAVALMNDSDYGLTASVWTKDIKAGEELVERIEAGTVYINRCDFPSPVRPLYLSKLISGLLTKSTIGPCVDWLEELGSRLFAWPAGLRCILQAEELPHQTDSRLRYRILKVYTS